MPQPFSRGDLDLGEGVDDEGKQEVEQDHEDEELISPEEERAGNVLEPGQGSRTLGGRS